MNVHRWIVLLAIVLLLAVGWLLGTRANRERAPTAMPFERAERSRDASASRAAPAALVAAEGALETRAVVETPNAHLPEPETPALRPGEALVRIHATARETGRDLAGVAVQVQAEGEHERLMIRGESHGSRGRTGDPLVTDERGLVECIVPGDRPLWLSTSLPQPQSWFEEELPPLATGETRAHEIALPTQLDALSRGRVIDAASRQPIAGASVALVGSDSRAQTDANGVFELATASWCNEVARIEAAGYARNVLDLDACNQTEPCLAPLYAVAALELRVSDARGAPAAGLRVRMKSPWAGNGGSGERFLALDGEQWLASTDDSGACTLELPPLEPLTLELLDVHGTTPLGRKLLHLEPGEHRVLTMSVGHGVAVEGRVVDGEGGPLAGVDVFLLPDDARFKFATYDERALADGRAFATESDAEGHFLFERVPDGTWWAGPGWKPGKDRKDKGAGVPVEVRVLEGLPVPPVVLPVWMGRCIRGRILAPDGRPFLPAGPQDCIVRATSATFSLHAYLFDDSFEIGPLMPGMYRMTAEEATGLADSEPLMVRDGEENVLLRLREGGTLAGNVLDRAGNGVANLPIVGKGSGRTHYASTDAVGAFVFEQIAPGPFDLFASSSVDVASLRATVERGVERTGLVLRLEAPARPVIRVAGDTRDLRCIVRIDGRWAGSQRLDAPETQIAVPPGALELQLFRRTHGEPVLLATRTLLAVAGEEPVVEFDLGPSRATR